MHRLTARPAPRVRRVLQRARRRGAGRGPGHVGADPPHAAPTQLRRRRGLVLAAGRGRLGARPDQHGARPRRRNVHRQPRQPRAPGRRARVRARVGRHAAGSRQRGARLPAAQGHRRPRLPRPAQRGAGSFGGGRHAGGRLHDRRARLLSRRRLARTHHVHHAALRPRHDDARGWTGRRDRAERGDRAGQRSGTEHPELRRAGPRRLGHLELRAHRRADRFDERALRPRRRLRRGRSRSLWRLARGADVRSGVGAERRGDGLGAIQHGTLDRRSLLRLDVGRRGALGLGAVPPRSLGQCRRLLGVGAGPHRRAPRLRARARRVLRRPRGARERRRASSPSG